LDGFRNEALRVAFIDEVEMIKNGQHSTEYYSKLVKADIHGKDKASSFTT
jgi:callose synthase